MKLFDRYKARIDINFKNPYTNRTIKVKVGDMFTITNLSYLKSEGLVKIDRVKGARLNSGYFWEKEMLEQFFKVIE